jgi:hypothetical protein
MDGPSCIPDQQPSTLTAVVEAVASQRNTSTHSPLVVVLPDAATSGTDIGEDHGHMAKVNNNKKMKERPRMEETRVVLPHQPRNVRFLRPFTS